MVMMIIMPALTECQQGEPKIVSAVVATVKTNAPPTVGQRVDRIGRVPRQSGRQRKAPHQARESADSEAEDAQRNGGNEVPSIQPN